MSNESENKRIDLTQFEGITEGPWEYEMLTLVTAYPHPAITINQTEGDLRLRLGKVSCPQDGKAMAKLPDLIAELKRLYEREDALVGAIKELCDSEDSTGCSGDLTVVSLDPILRLYELTSYSAYR